MDGLVIRGMRSLKASRSVAYRNDRGPKIPRSRVHYVTAMAWSPSISPRSPRRTVYRVSPTGPHPSALGDAAMDGGTEHKNNKSRNRLQGTAFMMSPAGFEPATTGIRRTGLECLECRTDAPKSLSTNGFRIAECLRCRSRNTRSMASW